MRYYRFINDNVRKIAKFTKLRPLCVIRIVCSLEPHHQEIVKVSQWSQLHLHACKFSVFFSILKDKSGLARVTPANLSAQYKVIVACNPYTFFPLKPKTKRLSSLLFLSTRSTCALECNVLHTTLSLPIQRISGFWASIINNLAIEVCWGIPK